ncbi:histidine kinase [Microbacterium lacus]|uniref:histidine kinase n=1 Tax=Microbacterium lacus TaxID=415217 RepID=UPI00384E769D
MRTRTIATWAAILVGLEGAAILALAGWQLVAVVTGDTASISSALALLVLTVVGGIAVLAFAVAIYNGRSWGRSGAIVTQVLILAVALGAATGDFAHPLTAALIAAPALVAFVLLILVARDAGREASAHESPHENL